MNLDSQFLSLFRHNLSNITDKGFKKKKETISKTLIQKIMQDLKLNSSSDNHPSPFTCNYQIQLTSGKRKNL